MAGYPVADDQTVTESGDGVDLRGLDMRQGRPTTTPEREPAIRSLNKATIPRRAEHSSARHLGFIARLLHVVETKHLPPRAVPASDAPPSDHDRRIITDPRHERVHAIRGLHR